MTECNLCGGMRWETLEAAGATRVVRCACGLVFVTSQPDRPLLERVYDQEYYKPWQGQARRQERIWRRRMARVEALFSTQGRLLDVGCGTGDFLRVAQTRGWDVSGTELSPYATEATAEMLRVFPGEVWEAGFPAEAFDVVTCWHVIEHASEPRRVLQEMCRVLRHDGWLVLATTNLDDHLFRTAYMVARHRRPRLYEPEERELHLFHFSSRVLKRMVESAGLEVVEVGFDRGAAAVWGTRLVNGIAYWWFQLMGLNWGMGLEVIARKPGAQPAREDG